MNLTGAQVEQVLEEGRQCLLRRPLEHVLAEGFEVEQTERYKAGIVERLSAHRPG
jgi:hypothetical protein